jgi:hypothetical protein
MIDAAHLKIHRTAASLKKGETSPQHIGRPVKLSLTTGNVNDIVETAELLKNLFNVLVSDYCWFIGELFPFC